MPLRILFVNCYQDEKELKFQSYAQALQLAADPLMPIEIIACNDDRVLTQEADFAGVILSGSHKMVGQGQIFPELIHFILQNKQPLLGICYGHQVLARAFQGWVEKDTHSHHGEEEIVILRPNSLLNNLPERCLMMQSHEEVVQADARLADHFHVLARNTHSHGVEIIRHHDHPFYGVQFHPERSGPLGIKLLGNFLHLVKEYNR